MQKLIIENGEAIYVDLSQKEIDEVLVRVEAGLVEKDEAVLKEEAKKEALARLRGDASMADLLLVLGLN